VQYTCMMILIMPVSVAGHGLITNYSNRLVVEELLYFNYKYKSYIVPQVAGNYRQLYSIELSSP
jgi:hypothetical protein